jgi:hypothetical protein
MLLLAITQLRSSSNLFDLIQYRFSKPDHQILNPVQYQFSKPGHWVKLSKPVHLSTQSNGLDPVHISLWVNHFKWSMGYCQNIGSFNGPNTSLKPKYVGSSNHFQLPVLQYLLKMQIFLAKSHIEIQGFSQPKKKGGKFQIPPELPPIYTKPPQYEKTLTYPPPKSSIFFHLGPFKGIMGI